MLTLSSMRLRRRIWDSLLLAARGARSALRRRLCDRLACLCLEVEARQGAGEGERGMSELLQLWRVLETA